MRSAGGEHRVGVRLGRVPGMRVALLAWEEAHMDNRSTLAALACGVATATVGLAAKAQSAVSIPTAVPIMEESRILPNPALLGGGLGTIVLGYTPAMIVGIVSDHKGDNKLFIPVVGPWLDLGQRGCSGTTVVGPNGPFDLSSQQNCGTSGIETAALIVTGVVQGVGAAEMVASFFIPQRRFAPVHASKKTPTLTVGPSSFGGRGWGAVAGGQF
jgi:hypothetical protein